MADFALAGLSRDGRREHSAPHAARTPMRLYPPLLLALAISLLVHLGALLAGRLPGAAPETAPGAELRPLAVKMTALALDAPEPAAATPTPAPARKPAPPQQAAVNVPSTPPAATAVVAEASAEAPAEPPVADHVAAPATDDSAAAPTPPPESQTGDSDELSTPPPELPDGTAGLEAKAASAPRRFPDNAVLDYQIYYGSLMAGHGEVSWQRRSGSYTLEARLTPIFGPGLRYQSRGSVGKNGLTPLAYQAWRGDTEREAARFDWASNTLAYGDRDSKEAPLTPGAQDILSLGYQLALTGGSRLPMPLRITTGKKVYDYPLAASGETRYPPDHGTLRVVVFRAKHGEGLTEFWLAPDFANLPVRILRVDKDKTIDQRARRIDINGKTVWSLSEPH